MLTEFCLLAALTLNDDVRQILRDKIKNWAECFLPKLKRESTREEQCRLVASVERHKFREDEVAYSWIFFKFVGDEGFLFDDEKKQLLDEFKATSFQKKILCENPSLSDVLISRSGIKEENGEWRLDNVLKEKIISEGGEAIVFSEKFGQIDAAVRLQIFDPFLFTKQFDAGQIKWKTHLISGKLYFGIPLFNSI